eukprot:symbB.v1.2.022370.t1/scaffold1982.1/size93808/2
MEDMLHGLSLLGPRLEQMSVHIEKLSKEVADQRTLLSQKAEQQEISQWGHPVRTWVRRKGVADTDSSLVALPG